MKICSKCHVRKPLTDFHQDRKAKDGLRAECKPCRSMTRANPITKSKQAVSRIKYRVQNAGRDIENTLTSYEVAMILDEGSCMYCQAPLEYTASTIDHVLPLSRGGRNTFDNLACACSKCNTAKRDTPAILFMLQSCDPYANRKLLERLALRSGRTVPEIYEILVEDVKEYFASRAEVTSSG